MSLRISGIGETLKLTRTRRSSAERPPDPPLFGTLTDMLPPILSAGPSSSTTATSVTIDTSNMHDNTFSLQDQNAVLLAEIERVETEYADFRARYEAGKVESEMLRAENERLREELDVMHGGKGDVVVSSVMVRLTVAPC